MSLSLGRVALIFGSPRRSIHGDVDKSNLLPKSRSAISCNALAIAVRNWTYSLSRTRCCPGARATHPLSALLTPAISSLIVTNVSPLASKATHCPTDPNPSAMSTPRISSLIVTAPSLLQSPIQLIGIGVAVGVRVGVPVPGVELLSPVCVGLAVGGSVPVTVLGGVAVGGATKVGVGVFPNG